MSITNASTLVSDQNYQPRPPKPQHSPVPKQYVGQARLLINRIKSLNESLDTSARAVYAPIAERARRNPTPRYERSVEAVRAWECNVPRDGRLDITVELERKSLSISDLRLSYALYSKDDWVAYHTPSLLINRYDLQASHGHTGLKTTTLALLSLHTLARWYERSGSHSEAVLFNDLLFLAHTCDALRAMARKTGRWELHAPSGGRFMGSIGWRIRGANRREDFLSIDTFKPSPFIRWPS
jgi:hypothetical protein